MHVFACLDLIAISSAVVLEPGTLQAEDLLKTKLALQKFPRDFSFAHSIPSTDGISNLYIPYLLVVLLTENEICSVVLEEIALNMHSILTSTPASHKN